MRNKISLATRLGRLAQGHKESGGNGGSTQRAYMHACKRKSARPLCRLPNTGSADIFKKRAAKGGTALAPLPCARGRRVPTARELRGSSGHLPPASIRSFSKRERGACLRRCLSSGHQESGPEGSLFFTAPLARSNDLPLQMQQGQG